jgi:hypothetical protein
MAPTGRGAAGQLRRGRAPDTSAPPTQAACWYGAAVQGDRAPSPSLSQRHAPSTSWPGARPRSGAALAALSIIVAGRAVPAAAQPKAAAPTPGAASSSDGDATAPTSSDPADAAFTRGAELLAARCAQLKDSYVRGDRRTALLRALSDCYLVEADLSRASGLRADAERQEDARQAGAAGKGDPLDLTELDARWGEACASFQRSLELEPSSGAQLAVALCQLRDGKLVAGRATVQRMLPQLRALAAAGDPFHRNRLTLARALLDEIERLQPKVTLRVATAPVPQLAIDGQPVDAEKARPLDAGTYRVTARRADGDAALTVTLSPRSHLTLTLEEEHFQVSRSWTIATWTLAGSAAAAAVVGAGAWWYASRRLDDFRGLGGTEASDLVCADGPDQADCARAARDVNRWRSVRAASLVTAAGLALGAVAVRVLTPSSRPARLRWVPQVDRDQLAVSVQGGF